MAGPGRLLRLFVDTLGGLMVFNGLIFLYFGLINNILWLAIGGPIIFFVGVCIILATTFMRRD